MHYRSVAILTGILFLLMGPASGETPDPADRDAENGMVIRGYHGYPSYMLQRQQAPARQDANPLKSFLAAEGINWPPGSLVSYQPEDGILTAYNTSTNLDELEALLSRILPHPFQIEIEATFISLDKGTGDELSMTGTLNPEAVKQAWRKGKAKILSAPRVITQSGQEATLKMMKEVIYPTEFEIGSVTNGTSGTITRSIVPTAFETREVGSILNILPEVTPEGTMINMTLAPEYVTLDTWEEYESVLAHENDQGVKVMCRTPVFKKYVTQTSVLMKDGVTLLLSADVGHPDDDTYQVLLLRALLVGTDGLPLRPAPAD
jgi:hypothetical protein